LHITVVVEDPFESRVAYLHIVAALVSPFEGRILNYEYDAGLPDGRYVNRLAGILQLI